MDVEVRYIDDTKGKGLFAKRGFESGTTIFEEKPLVCCQFSWNKAYKYRACDHCLRPLETAEENARRLTGINNLELPYMECCNTVKDTIVSCDSCGTEYCCQECKNEAKNQYHAILCHPPDPNHPLDRLEEAWKQVHYPPETNSIMLIVRLLARILQAPDRNAAIAQTLQFSHRTVNEDAEIAHKLLGENFASQLSLLHSLLVEAIPKEGIEQFLSPDGFQSLAALIGTNGQGVGTSAISQWVTRASDLPLSDGEKASLDKFIDKLYEQLDSQSGSFLNNEGVALFTLQSACNHSCVPNAEPTYPYNNNVLCLEATRDIQPGEEIVISYLDECNLSRSRHSRRKHLMENYLFLCNCEKCQEQANDPDVTSEEESEDEDMSD